jgi:hypothetical protein
VTVLLAATFGILSNEFSTIELQNQSRLPDGKDKRLLLRAIQCSRPALPLRSLLRVIRLSESRYHAWNRKEQCELDDSPSCPRISPHQLTLAEVAAIGEFVTSEEYRHVPMRSDKPKVGTGASKSNEI